MAEHSEAAQTVIIDSREHREWADHKVDALIRSQKREAIFIGSLSFVLLVTSMVAVFVVSREGIDLTRVLRIFSDAQQVFSPSDKSLKDGVNKITSDVLFDGEEVILTRQKIKFVEQYMKVIDEFEGYIVGETTVYSQLGVINSNYRFFNLVDLSYGVDFEGAQRSILSISRFSSSSDSVVENRVSGKYISYDSGRISFSDREIFKFPAIGNQSWSFLAIPKEEQEELVGAVLSYLAVQRQKSIDLMIEFANEESSQLIRLQGNVSQSFGTLLSDPWGDSFRVVRYIALVLMIYTIFFTCLKVIIRKVRILDELLALRVHAIYTGAENATPKGAVTSGKTWRIGSYGDDGLVTPKILLSKIFVWRKSRD
ncbi:MAG: hypothetical protein KTR23_10985 [Rhodospirillales bacterium]|nr:hypothetical protein [Rhodospirillales bacterium]